MENNKGVISLNIDSNIIQIINKTQNKSAFVNQILKQHLITQDTLTKEILETKQKLKTLLITQNKIITEQDTFLENVPPEFIQALKPEPLTAEEKIHYTNRDTRKIKSLVTDNTTLNFWTQSLNERFFTKYTPEQFQQILNKHG